eukprot:gnl/TRDRNA2_/TRDRNA2_81760_c0_seq1.p1 gnl/TRDRNA2_/TRDRNA2_81760_c0~~gnl/TRDRNA2_/TRDRNA2_81760_c0_seq1.p1  ORF type:complete len:508 (-),score=90.69 gnl/TRDRNA2_/TRDRNA2_81760_c0_seq1:53-1537(-)
MWLLLLPVSLWAGHGRAATLLNDPVPLTEYYSRTLKDYKGLAWNEITKENASPMLRLKNLHDDEFKELVRKGYPFVVDDCAPPDATLRDFPCSEYGKRWPQEHMRAEYTPGQVHIHLKDPEWYSVQKPTAKAPKHLSQGKPLSGPYIWHVKDETESKETKPAIQKIFPVPYFLNGSTLNRNEARDSFEFWFVLENGGSQAHADAYCETTISLQLRGRKTWRLGAFPNITNAFHPYSFHDADIYKRDEFWRPEHEVVVEPGQCVVFPMGYIHETYVGEGEGGVDGCSVATTFQFQDPQPVHQWRNFLNRWGLSHYTRDEPCLSRMEPYIFFGQKGLSKVEFSEEQLREKATQSFTHVDFDKDGLVTLSELEEAFEQIRPRELFPWTEVGSDVMRAAQQEKVDWRAQDTLLYHDTDGDGIVHLEEFVTHVLQFMAVKRRAHTIKRMRKRPDELLDKERQWIREHLCTSDDCVHLKELEREYTRKSRRNQKIIKQEL